MLSTFGTGHDLAIFDDANPNGNYSNFGHSYELPEGMKYDSDQARSYLAGLYNFKVKEFEVYSVKSSILLI